MLKRKQLFDGVGEIISVERKLMALISPEGVQMGLITPDILISRIV